MALVSAGTYAILHLASWKVMKSYGFYSEFLRTWKILENEFVHGNDYFSVKSETWLAVGCFEVTSRNFASLNDEEERLMPVLSNLSRQYLSLEYGAHRASSERVTADQVDDVSLATVTYMSNSFVVTRHTHTQLFYGPIGFCPGLPRWTGTRKVKPMWIYCQSKR